jgi:hypothetical protein
MTKREALPPVRHAATDVSYRAEKRVHLPVEPPAWHDQTHGPYPLSTAMATALEAVHARGVSVLADYVRSPVRQEKDLFRLRRILDRAAAAIAYAEIPGEDDWSWPASTCGMRKTGFGGLDLRLRGGSMAG